MKNNWNTEEKKVQQSGGVTEIEGVEINMMKNKRKKKLKSESENKTALTLFSFTRLHVCHQAQISFQCLLRVCLHVCIWVHVRVCVCCFAFRAQWRRRNAKESHHCITSSQELFKDHAAPRLHVNAIIISADATLTFSVLLPRLIFLRGERQIWQRGGAPSV